MKIEERTEEVPDVVVRRLPRYANALRQLLKEGVSVASSELLGARAGVSAGQVRRDLSYFGEFGKQGTGYDATYLLNNLNDILNLGREWRVCVVGMGLLGQAIARYRGFQEVGFRVVAAFDRDPEVVGSEVENLTVLPASALKEECQAQGIQIAIVAVPAAEAQGVADELVSAGVKAILNYAPAWVNVPPGVTVRYLDPVVSLQSMTYYLAPKLRVRGQGSRVKG